MAALVMSPEVLEETVQRVERALEDGHSPPWQGGGGAIAAAARKAVDDGFCRTESAFKSRLDFARSRLRDPDWSRWRAPVYQRPQHSPPLDSHKILDAAAPTGKRVKVCMIGDAHDDPRLEDKSRFLWLGRWANEVGPDQIVQIGDWMTCDSMSTHTEKGSKEQMLQPSWTQDVESLYESINTFEKGLQRHKAKKMMTEGNHERRAARYENANPSVGNVLTAQWRGAFRENGWNIRDFGEYYFIEGVGFIHHMINGAGRAFGGKTGDQRAGNDLMFSVVHGHDHKRAIYPAAKIGPTPEVTVMSLGCALPWGWVEDYARHAITGWWWGAACATLQDGMITDIEYISMLDLEAKYADKKKATKKT